MRHRPSRFFRLGILFIGIAILAAPTSQLKPAAASGGNHDELLWLQGGSVFVLDGEGLSTVGETTGMGRPQADPVLADVDGDGADELYWYHDRPGDEGSIHRLRWNGSFMAYEGRVRGPGVGQGYAFTAGDINGRAPSRGDVFAAGVRYCATTYLRIPDFTEQPHGSGQYGAGVNINHVIDLTVPTTDRDLFAPANGSVTVVDNAPNEGLGNSVLWRSEDGSETLQLSHLSDFGRAVRNRELGAINLVAAGDHIGHVGKTGLATGPHLHITREVDGRLVPLRLSGRQINPGSCYTAQAASSG